MFHFLLISLVLLLAAAPNFFTTEYFIIDAITDEVIALEPMDASAGELIYHRQSNSELEEGQVVEAKMAGGRIYRLTPDPEKTEQRRGEIQAILARLRTTSDCD